MDKMKPMFRGKTATARLAEIETAIGAAETERRHLTGRRPAEIVAKLTTGEPAAAERVAALDAELLAIDARLRDLRDAEGELRRRIAEEQDASRQRQIEEHGMRAALARCDYLAAVERLQQHALGMAEELRGLAVHADALAAAIGSADATRSFCGPARLHRMQSGLARAFAIDKSRSLSAANSLLGVASHEVGVRSNWTPIEHEETTLDELAPFFADQAEAEAARDRLAARGSKTAIVALPGVFHLVRAERVFGDAAEAGRAARAGGALSVVPLDDGFALVDARFCGGM